MKTTPDNATSTSDFSGLCAAEMVAVISGLQQQLAVKKVEIQQRDQAVKQRDNYIQILEELLRYKKIQQFAASSEKSPCQFHLFDEAELEAEIDALRDQLGVVAWSMQMSERALPETDFRRCVGNWGGQVQSSG